MNRLEFQERLAQAALPVIVELWAPWCGPCRAMAPALAQVSAKYVGRVEVWKLNADEEPEVVRALGVMGILTLIGFSQADEIVRQTGGQSQAALEMLFEAVLSGRKDVVLPPAPLDRWIRSLSGLALIVLGWWYGPPVWLIGAGALLIFSAFYDRCPLYRAIAPRLAAFFRRR